MELNDNDKQRIEQEAKKFAYQFNTQEKTDISYRSYLVGAEYATIYEREKLERVKKAYDYMKSSRDEMDQKWVQAKDEIKQLEAERSELRNKVIELEQTIKKIQDKSIELYGNQIELP